MTNTSTPFVDDKPNTAAECLRTVFWTPNRTEEAAQALYCGVENNAQVMTTRYSELSEETGLYLWHGGIPDSKKAGTYLVPNPYMGSRLYKPDGTIRLEAVRDRIGLRSRDIGLHTVSFGEIDDIPLADQAERLDSFEISSGLRFSVLALSGDTRPKSIAASGLSPEEVEAGKSIHYFLSLEPCSLEMWTEIQLHLIAYLKSDRSIKNPDRLMRLPGAQGYLHGEKSGVCRLQTVLRVLPQSYKASEVLKTLQSLCSAKGVSVDNDSSLKSARKAGASSSGKSRTYLDFTQFTPEGTGGANFYEWTLQNLRPGYEVAIGFPFEDRAAGDSIRDGQSCQLHRDENGHIYLHSFKTGVTYHHRPETPAGMFDLTMEAPSTAGSPNASVVQYAPEDLVLGKYLPHQPLTQRVTFVRAPWGTGKTQLAGYLRDQSKKLSPGASVVSITHRRTLAEQQSQRLGLANYMAVAGTVWGDSVVSLDSILRLGTYESEPLGEVRPIQFSLVILDEVSQLIQHLFSGTLSGPESAYAYKRLSSLLRTADQVVCFDADLDQFSIRQVRTLMGLDPAGDSDQQVRVLQASSGFDYRDDPDPLLTGQDLLQEWSEGKNLAVYCQSKQVCETWALRLREARPGSRLMVVDSDTVKEPEVARFLADPSLASQYNALVYTGSLGTGFSVETPNHFHRTYVFSSEFVGTVNDLFQGAHRVRNPISKEIRIACAEGIPGTRTTDPEEIYSRLVSLQETTDRLVNASYPPAQEFALGELDLEGERLQLKPDHEPHLRCYCEVVSYQRLRGGPGGNRRGAFLAYLGGLETLGSTVTHTELVEAPKELRAADKEARKRVREERCREVYSAPVVPMEEVRSVREATSRSQAMSFERAHILDFYGFISLKLVEEDDQGRLRSQARAWARLKTFYANPKALLEVDRRERKAGVPSSHAGFHTLHAASFSGLLARAGLKGVPSSWGGQTISVNEGFVAFARNNARALAALGVTVRSDVAKKPVQLVSSILAKLGLTLSCRKNAKGAEVYRVKEEEVERMDSLSEKYLEKITDPDSEGKSFTVRRASELEALFARMTSEGAPEKGRRNLETSRVEIPGNTF